MKKLVLLSCLALAGSAFAQVHSEDNDGSLFNSKTYRNPLTDRTARNVGDILTVVVIENITSNLAASTTGTKNDSNQVGIGIPLLKALGANFSTSAASTVSGGGTTTNTSQLTATVSVIVKSIDPNGNMIVEGTRWVKVNGEETNITFTGTVRRDDIAGDNTISSGRVANVRIENKTKGLIAERQRKGFLTRLLDWLF